MKISDKGLRLIKQHEGLRLQAYYDQIGKPTIGYGSTFFENGRPVRMGDKITIERAEALLRHTVDKIFSESVNKLVTQPLTQNQFDAIISLVYNIGTAGLAKSGLLKRVNINPNDPLIAGEFAKWRLGTIGGKKMVLPGLVNRRKQEAELYFSK